MLLIKSSTLLYKFFPEQVIVFDPNTGQTHCLDSNASEILNRLTVDIPRPLSQLKQFFTQNCLVDEKTMLNDYIQDMIDSLLQLKLIHACSV